MGHQPEVLKLGDDMENEYGRYWKLNDFANK